MQAVILAGGKGTRLKPYTNVLPKPLMPVGQFPILEIIIRQLKAHNITDIILSVGYLHHLIQAYFGNGEKLGVNISYSMEDSPLGTAGPLSLIENLQDTFLVMNGDLLTDINYYDFYSSHLNSGKMATIGVCKREIKISLGVIEIGPQNDLIDYIEKPTHTYWASMGIYCMNKEVINLLTPNEYFDLPDLMLKLKDNSEPINVFQFSDLWLDVGRIEDYEKANDLMAENPHFFFQKA